MGKRGKETGTLLLIILIGIFLPVFLVSCGGGGSSGTPTPAPVAGFSASPTTGAAPLIVAFTDQTTGGATSWSWNFGDGGTSTLQNPTHNYVTSGNYTVSLTATGPGGSNTNTKSGHVKITPLAQFSALPTTGSEPLTVSFTNLSTGGATTWLWDFGDDGTSTLQNPTHDYTLAGSYTVSLTATGPGGSNTNTKQKIITVGTIPPAPVALFSASPTTGAAPQNVTFTDQSTGIISTWSWDFGDGGTSALQNPTHNYVTSGTYTVALTATGPGGTNTNTKVGYINVTPLSQFSASPTTGAAPLIVTFTDQSTGGATTWLWDFGDGGTSAAQNPSHTFAAGSYTVSLTATGPGGSNINTKPNFITVGAPPVPPVAGFLASPTTGFIPLTVAFTDQSTGVVSTWSWDFGDGGTSTLQNPSHNYIAAGTYTVSLTATGPGGSNTNTKANHISTSRPVFTDNFNRANANPIGGNWTTAPGCSNIQLLNNAAYATDNVFFNCAYWNANTFTDDQYSQVTIAHLESSKGPAVRIQTGGAQQNFYYVKIDNVTTLSIKKNVNGSFSTIPPKFTVPVLTGTDTIRLSVTGSTLELFLNGVSLGTVTDTTFPSGAPGFWHFFTTEPLDDWEGGSL